MQLVQLSALTVHQALRPRRMQQIQAIYLIVTLTSSDNRMLQRLRDISSRPCNLACADCSVVLQSSSKGHGWASINLRIFVASTAQVHRSLGTHVSKVRSLELDTRGGPRHIGIRCNRISTSNSIWEAELAAAQGL